MLFEKDVLLNVVYFTFYCVLLIVILDLLNMFKKSYLWSLVIFFRPILIN